MKKTRNLFAVTGLPADVTVVLDALQFKGMVTIPYGGVVNDEVIDKAHRFNRSIMFAATDYMGILPVDAYTIHVVSDHAESPPYKYTICATNHDDIVKQFERITDITQSDVGDHKSNTSKGGTDGPSVRDCAYCKYLQGDTESVESNERTLYRSENFFVIPTVGQFTTGYLLIIPYKHVMSNGELEPEVLAEFNDVLADIIEILQLAYPDANGFLVWENGSGSSGVGKAKDSLVHSHVHVAPSSLTSEAIEDISGFTFDEISLYDLKDYKASSYLLVRTPTPERWKILQTDKIYIPRQYVRQLIAEELSIHDGSWNWRTHPYYEKMHQTLEDVISALESNWDNLSNRIKENTKFLF